MIDREKLFFRWILPLSLVACLYAVIWYKIDSKIQLSDLEKRNGVIMQTSVSEEFRNKYFMIFLHNDDVLVLSSGWERWYGLLKERALPFKQVEYYCKPNDDGEFAPYQLKIEDRVIIKLSTKQKNSYETSFYMGVVFIIGLFAMVLRMCYVKRKDGNVTCGLIKALSFKTIF